MPIYDFICDDCQSEFEDIMVQSELPICPSCGGVNVTKKVSIPSPQKSRAFPFKVGPVHPIVKQKAGSSACPSAGNCGTGFS